MNLFDLNLTLPISDPTWVFFLVLIIILFAPMILGRLHIPHIIGMIPLLPDAMFGSLAASIMGGLLFGTLITLLFIPILYALFFHIKYSGHS